MSCFKYDSYSELSDFYLNIDKNAVRKLNKLEDSDIKTQRDSKRVIKYYNLDNALPEHFINYLLNVTTDIKKRDGTGFPGKKIFFSISNNNIKKITKKLSLIDSSIKDFEFTCAFLGFIKRDDVVEGKYPPNPHVDSQGQKTFAIMTYLNDVGGGTAFFKNKIDGHDNYNDNKDTSTVCNSFNNNINMYTEKYYFELNNSDAEKYPYNDKYWKIESIIDCIKNKTVLMKTNYLHNAIFDLDNWPEDTEYRITFNIFLNENTKELRGDKYLYDEIRLASNYVINIEAIKQILINIWGLSYFQFLQKNIDSFLDKIIDFFLKNVYNRVIKKWDNIENF